MEVSESQLWKAQSPIEVTLLGIVIEVMEVQMEKAESPIVFMPSGTTNSPWL